MANELKMAPNQRSCHEVPTDVRTCSPLNLWRWHRLTTILGQPWMNRLSRKWWLGADDSMV